MHWERFPFLHAFKGLFQLALRLASHSFFPLLSGLLLELHNSEEKRRMWHLLVTGLNGRKRAYCHRFWGLALTKTFKTLNKNVLESEKETNLLICSSNLDQTVITKSTAVLKDSWNGKSNVLEMDTYSMRGYKNMLQVSKLKSELIFFYNNLKLGEWWRHNFSSTRS